MPSPSKSATPATLNVPGAILPTPPTVMAVAPFISHTARLPLVSSHRMSPRPSALKSPVPTTVQPVGTFPMLCAVRTWVPCMN
jgi:hypothetical protein